MIGLHIEGFVIERQLAEGGMGAVYLARHKSLPIMKVVKTVLATYAHHENSRKRFTQEASAISKLNHPGIIGVDSFGVLPSGELWLMMPFLHGESLDRRLANGPISAQQMLRIAFQICSALEHAHRAGVIHRDLKPSNIFLCPTERDPSAIKLIDFGLAKNVGTPNLIITRTGAVVGTPAYMAVEQYERGATRRSDLYSLAIIIHEMITGVSPWGVAEPSVLYYMKKTMPPALSAGVWDHVLAKALALDPNLRWDSARSFAMALASVTDSGMAVLRETAPELLRDGSGGELPRPPRSRAADVTMRSDRALEVTQNSTMTPLPTPMPTPLGIVSGFIDHTPPSPLCMGFPTPPRRDVEWRVLLLGMVLGAVVVATVLLAFLLVRR